MQGIAKQFAFTSVHSEHWDLEELHWYRVNSAEMAMQSKQQRLFTASAD